MTDPYGEAWELAIRDGEESDRRNRDNPNTWVPPIHAALVRAARETALRRFYPYVSVSQLRFDLRPPDEPIPQNPAPILIAWGKDPDRYVVFRWDDPDVNPVILLETADPREAAELAAHELAGWPGQR